MKSAGCCVIAYAIACVIACAPSIAWADTGSTLLQYESALGTLPAQQGWTYASHCLRTRCPAGALPSPDPTAVDECYFQGGMGNDCTLGHGCGPDASPVSRAEHFNAPPEPVAARGACTYTEWLAFDDGEDFLDMPFPAPLPHRNLTFGPAGGNATNWGPHAHPAFGAPGFVNAPSGYPPLRIVTGGGVPGVNTLPASGTNARNTGRLEISRNYVLPTGTTAVTLVAKLACGNRRLDRELIQLRGCGHCFSLGVDGQDGSPTLGHFGRGTTQSLDLNIFETRTVGVALARETLQGPHQGEFFTVRIILAGGGAVQAWLNDDISTAWTGTTGAGAGHAVLINPDEQAGTMWVDYVRLLEGAVPPPPRLCGDPAFDINHDGQVNGVDRFNGLDGFLDCATGPAIPAANFETLPERCRCHDVNGDGTVDMIDFAAFQRCLTLTDAPADPSCDD